MKRLYTIVMVLSIAITEAIHITASSYSSCVILDNDQIECWGSNFQGQLGYGDTNNRGDEAGEMGDALPSVNLGTGRTAKAVSGGGGSSHICAVLDNDNVKCWGANTWGQLGIGSSRDQGGDPGHMGANLAYVDLGTDRTAKAISVGAWHSCAILDNDQVKCWGANAAGQLGSGDTDSRGDQSGEMGDSLPTVDLGTDRTAKALSTGGSYQMGNTCAILDNDQVKCWGYNTRGQLGYGDTANRGGSSGDMGDNLPTIDLGTGRTVKALTTGKQHMCAILDDDSVKCWGDAYDGQLGYGNTNARGDGTGEMGDDLPTVNLGTGRSASAIAAGGFSVCALLDNGQVKCWGDNDKGQLGYGDTDDRGGSSSDMGDSLVAVDLGTERTASAIASGGGHICVLLDNSRVECWGGNSAGQLGYGDTNNRGDASGEMGDQLPGVDLVADTTTSGAPMTTTTAKVTTTSVVADTTTRVAPMTTTTAKVTTTDLVADTTTSGAPMTTTTAKVTTTVAVSDTIMISPLSTFSLSMFALLFGWV